MNNFTFINTNARLLCSVMRVRDSRTHSSKWTNFFSSNFWFIVCYHSKPWSPLIIWRKILECFHQNLSFLFDWRKKDMDILDYMGVS